MKTPQILMYSDNWRLDLSNKKLSAMSHIGLSLKDLGDCDTAILTGDPHRVAFLAKLIDKNARHLKDSREYHSYRVKINDKNLILIESFRISHKK